MKTVVVGGGDDVSNAFAAGLAEALGLEAYTIYRKVFPDGESYVKLPEEAVSADRVVLVRTMAPPQDKSIMETLMAIDALYEKGVKEVFLVAPYTAYARQDREFTPHEAVSIRALLRTLKRAGVKAYFTIEIHKEDSLKHFEGPAFTISPYEYMAPRVRVEHPILVLAPDIGAVDRARRFANAIGAEYDYIVKKRDRKTGDITIEPKQLPAKGKNVIIVDDIISTGGTVAKTTKLLLEQGAESVTVVVAHALLAGDAPRLLHDAGLSQVYAANTLPNRDPSLVEVIDVSPVVAEHVRKVLG